MRTMPRYKTLNYYALKMTGEAVLLKVLFPLLTSAAGGERTFNVYGSIHTKKRNKLGPEKLDSLARVKHNTKQLQRKLVPRSVLTLRALFSTDFKAWDDVEEEEEEGGEDDDNEGGGSDDDDDDGDDDDDDDDGDDDDDDDDGDDDDDDDDGDDDDR